MLVSIRKGSSLEISEPIWINKMEKENLIDFKIYVYSFISII